MGGQPEPYRFRRAWSSTSREEATRRVQAALQGVEGLIDVSESVGEAFADVMAAAAVSISLLNENEYWDVVTVGKLGPGEVRFPNERYPLSLYPFAAERLLSREGYISTDGEFHIGPDHPHYQNWTWVGSFMAAPVIANAEPRGQILMVRERTQPPYGDEDLQVATDLATYFGARLPDLVAQYGSSDF